MINSGFEVLHGGIFTLIQDQGRFGLNHIGVTQSGVMDEYAYFWANKLLNNDKNCVVLEILYTGLTLKATSSCMMSITGANLCCKINDKEIEPWQSFYVQQGDLITFTKNKTGQRAYLAVKGGFEIPLSYGSSCVSVKEQLGGIDGKPLKKGDFLLCSSSKKEEVKKVQPQFIPTYKEHLIVRVVLGYQQEYFSQEQQALFFNSTYKVTHENNRMGMKLEGQNITCKIDGIISEGIAYGAIQIPKDGQPIILLKERQTIGGYPKIGSVLSIDCFKLAQAKAGTTIQFEEIGLQEAQEKVRAFYTMFKD